ncbi:MAG: T9SS type A sorting domain-containing protein [Bacteroidales bacterium]|nr:T9SS type A sorting domain-containing protein [Bacteroidales bacterium]
MKRLIVFITSLALFSVLAKAQDESYYYYGKEKAMTVDGGDAISVMDVSSLPNGIYLLRAVTDNGVETGRFVKN